MPPPYGFHLSAPALWLSQICEGAWRTPALGHLIGEWAVYFKSNIQFIFLYTKKSYFLLLLGAPALECARHLAGCFILSVRINYHARCLAHSRGGAPNRGVGRVFHKKYLIHICVHQKVIFPSPIRCPNPGVCQSPGAVIYSDCQNKLPC